MNGSSARQKIEQARYFIIQALKAGQEDREELLYNFEAAIVFARSITFCLQKGFCDKEGFSAWYSIKRNEMKQNPLFRLFLERRNYILKKGTTAVHKKISIEVKETISFSDPITCRIIHSRPWHGETLIRILKTALSLIKRRNKKGGEAEIEKKMKPEVSTSNLKVTESYFICDSGWAGKDVFKLFGDYLDLLELIVSEAEAKFA